MGKFAALLSALLLALFILGCGSTTKVAEKATPSPTPSISKSPQPLTEKQLAYTYLLEVKPIRREFYALVDKVYPYGGAPGKARMFCLQTPRACDC